ncbi:MAG: DMT family transporter [Pseudomonadota bacterium]
MNDPLPTARDAQLGMLLWAVIVGLSFPAVALLSEGLPPMLLTAIRFSVAAAAIAPLMLRSSDFWPGGIGFALYTVLGVALAFFFGAMFWAAHRSTPLSMSAIYVSVPLLAYFFGRMLAVEQPAGSLLGVLALGAAGALGLVWAGAEGRADRLSFGLGEAVYFFGCMASATYPVLSKWGLAKGWLSDRAEVRTFWSLVSGSILVGLLGFIFENPARLARMTTLDTSIVVYLGLFSSGLTFWLTQRAAAVLTPGVITAYSYLVPLVSMVWLFAEDSDRIGGHWLPGSLTVLLAIALLLGREDAGHRFSLRSAAAHRQRSAMPDQPRRAVAKS